MSSPITPVDEEYKCLECSKIFSRKFNLQRHLVRVHHLDDDLKTQQKGDTVQQKWDTVQQKWDTVQQKWDTCEPIENDTDTDKDVSGKNNYCPNCYKTFSHNWCLIRHTKVCKGNIKNECNDCRIVFNNRKALYRHCKNCDVKNKQPAPDNNPTSNVVQSNNNNNINTQNNNIINTQNNNIIIVYNKDLSKNLKTDHLTEADFRKILRLATPHVDSRAMSEFSKQIFSNPENRCVKKTNLRSSHSEIHTGDNSWSLELDKRIYPQLANEVAANMTEYLYTKRKSLKEEVFNRLTEFVDYMSDYGYINTDEVDRKRQIREEYNTFMNGLKLIIYEKTK